MSDGERDAREDLRRRLVDRVEELQERAIRYGETIGARDVASVRVAAHNRMRFARSSLLADISLLLDRGKEE